jgi:hypothetical protein
MHSQDERPTSLLLNELLFEALRVGDERINALAIELFGRCGEGTVHSLVLAASDRKNRPPHRLRVLRAIARIGTITEPASHFELWSLLRDRNPTIQAMTADVIRSLGFPVSSPDQGADRLGPVKVGAAPRQPTP